MLACCRHFAGARFCYFAAARTSLRRAALDIDYCSYDDFMPPLSLAAPLSPPGIDRQTTNIRTE